MVDRLEEAGLVQRRRDEADRRAWNIFLTDKARPLIEELQALADGLHADALAGVSDAERKTVRQVLEQVRTNIGTCGVEPARKVS
jgi:DNA-binding MarR family transcriptional regulator